MTMTRLQVGPRMCFCVLAIYSGVVLLLLVTPRIMVVVMSFSAEYVLGFPPHSWSLLGYASYLGDPTWLAATSAGVSRLLPSPRSWRGIVTSSE
jgi:ABC-type spermidine/putrescine transport system permease subunit II